jgi:hypothetical protein
MHKPEFFILWESVKNFFYFHWIDSIILLFLFIITIFARNEIKKGKSNGNFKG